MKIINSIVNLKSSTNQTIVNGKKYDISPDNLTVVNNKVRRKSKDDETVVRNSIVSGGNVIFASNGNGLFAFLRDLFNL